MAAEKRTYFSDPGRMFPEIDDGGKVPTAQFLNACQGIADFVGFLGTAFTPVKLDISGNVKKVRSAFDRDPANMQFVQDLVDYELERNGGQLGYATEGLLWLKRGLEFMLELLKLLVQEYQGAKTPAERAKSENMSAIISQAYGKTLQRHHGFISKQLFKVVIHAAPYRKDLLKALAYGNAELEGECVQHMADLLGNFETNIESIVRHYYTRALEEPPTK